MSKQKVNYHTYITSRAWRDKHPKFLKRAGYRCSFFPWIKCGKGHPYAAHHKTYKNLGNEQYGKDVIILCPLAHNWVIHGILSGFKSAGKQRCYPNLAQRIAHRWCNMPLVVKLLLILTISFIAIVS